LLVTGALVGFVMLVKHHYAKTQKLLSRLDELVHAVKEGNGTSASVDKNKPTSEIKYNPKYKTAVIMVNGFNGLGLHTLFNTIMYFGDLYKNYIFVEVGIINAGNFKGSNEMEALKGAVQTDTDCYVKYMRNNGYFAEGFTAVGIDVVEEITALSKDIRKKYPGAVFFGGQLVFGKESFITRLLHNYTIFAIQREFYQMGTPVVILPIRVY
jgi:hypothetical protein